ncbi:ABC transporter substrate-binding protein [Roseateles sp.]|uniref:substrate-binding periplasmic protein n=1 Tax=Roseateles sp. TaxID=1971397 RepID=UPI0025D0C09D|nr:transporter substrate-binding domain-containing protein [Roseateles sp.]MBV8037099.1 transporter substrate-binding domain-containing protein [Roseateles sp.]
MFNAWRRWERGLRGSLAALLLLGQLLSTGAEPARPLVMLVETSALMPQARIEGERVVEGLHLDLGQALARRLGRELVALPVPRKRLAEALQRGEGDLLCDYQSDWLPGTFAWSRPFLPDQALLISAATAPAPAGLVALAGQPLGTVRGYVYPEVVGVLRTGFRRDDAPDAPANLQKLGLGRVQHALTGRRVLEYQQRIGRFKLALHAPLVVSEVLARCALSPSSPVGLAALNAAIQGLVGDGELNHLLGRYR